MADINKYLKVAYVTISTSGESYNIKRKGDISIYTLKIKDSTIDDIFALEGKEISFDEKHIVNRYSKNNYVRINGFNVKGMEIKKIEEKPKVEWSLEVLESLYKLREELLYDFYEKTHKIFYFNTSKRQLLGMALIMEKYIEELLSPESIYFIDCKDLFDVEKLKLINSKRFIIINSPDGSVKYNGEALRVLKEKCDNLFIASRNNIEANKYKFWFDIL